jgi:hypothetical protein
VNKKTIYIIVAILAVVIVAVAAAALLMNNDGTSEPTPTPEPQSVADATSIQFVATDNTNDLVYDCAVRNINEVNEDVRLDMTVEGEVYSYIIKLEDSTSFLSMDSGETWTKTNFAEDSMYLLIVHGFIDELAENWDGQATTFSYTADDTDYVISNIKVNPTLEDSLFATS